MASKKAFRSVDPKADFPGLEEKILNYWKKNKIFEKSLGQESPKGEWTFLDGPPFITGLPHYGTLLSSIPKDVFPRFKTMQGYHVGRVWGWDCHGLPAENKVEEKLGIKRKKDIEEVVGIKRFVEECKLYVSEVSAEWEWYVDHIGRWVDFKNAYRTMDFSYMETVMWVFKQMYDKGLIYKGFRVSLYCPHCSTPISNFEVAMDADNYREVTETSTVYKYRLKDESDTYFLAWSTTPWNKLVTPALAVNPKLQYVKVKQGKEKYILAKKTLKILKSKPQYEILEEFLGKDLLGKKFIPHYDFYKIEKGKRAFIIIGGDFVTPDEGTGFVTIAAYGEDDLKVMQENNIQIVLHVDEEGRIKKGVPKWGGMYYLDADKEINKDLQKRGLIYREDELKHSVARCWRCQTRLFYAPQDAWYVNVQGLKKQMEKTNAEVNWYPEHFKRGRFLKSLQAAPDWNISRSRYWGSPVPVWECECGERYVPGSVQELEKLSDQKIKDLHRPGIDKVTIECKKCGGKARRVPEVLDSWIEAGSASFAEQKNPEPEKFSPPDFITEYTGQIRAWFYVVHVLANALYRSAGYKNVLVTGVILGDDGRKMSKNYGNFPDPKEMLEKYGGDALRLYLMGSPVMKGEDILISEEKYAFQKTLLLTLWNVYNFFVTYANLNSWQPSKGNNWEPKNVLDKWILSRMYGNIGNITKALENFDTPDAVGNLWIFIGRDLSLWYVRRSRDRAAFCNSNKEDKNDLFQTLWIVLTEYMKACAPIAPFISDYIYKEVTGKTSVHLEKWPEIKEEAKDNQLENSMDDARKVVERGHSARKESGIPVRQPLSRISVVYSNKEPSKDVVQLIKNELNVKDVKWKVKNGQKEPEVSLDTKLTLELEEEGKTRELARKIQQERKRQGVPLTSFISVATVWQPTREENVEWLKRRTLAREFKRGKKLQVKKLNK